MTMEGSGCHHLNPLNYLALLKETDVLQSRSRMKHPAPPVRYLPENDKPESMQAFGANFHVLGNIGVRRS